MMLFLASVLQKNSFHFIIFNSYAKIQFNKSGTNFFVSKGKHIQLDILPLTDKCSIEVKTANRTWMNDYIDLQSRLTVRKNQKCNTKTSLIFIYLCKETDCIKNGTPNETVLTSYITLDTLECDNWWVLLNHVISI